MDDFIRTRERLDSLLNVIGLKIKRQDLFGLTPDLNEARNILNALRHSASTDFHAKIINDRAFKLEHYSEQVASLQEENQSVKKGSSSSGNRSKTACCIYALKIVSDLDKAYKNGRKGCFVEDKEWVTGCVLLDDAKKMNSDLPIVFADADVAWELLYWAKLTTIEILPGKKTRYSFEDMKRYPKHTPPYNKTDLITESKRNGIDANFIRSYAICVRPAYLK